MRCPNCSTVNPQYARFCGHCGRELNLPAPACPYCSSPIAQEADFCTGCGRAIRDLSAPSVAQDTPTYLEKGETSQGLSPCELGDLLHKTFLLYRQNPALFLGIGLVAQIPSLVGVVAADLFLDILLTIAGFILVAIAQGAVVYAVASKHLGAPTSLRTSFSRAGRQAPSLVISTVLVAIMVVLLALSLPFSVILIGIPFLLFFLWRLVTLVFYLQAIMIENRNILDAFRRSDALVRGTWWRVFGIVMVFTLVVAITIVPVAVVVTLASDAWGELTLALASAMGMPWLMIGNTLLYFDLRVRKEGLTLDVLNSELGVAPNF